MSQRVVGLILCVPLLATGVRANAQTDPLPSWNDGAAKKAIVENDWKRIFSFDE